MITLEKLLPIIIHNEYRVTLRNSDTESLIYGPCDKILDDLIEVKDYVVTNLTALDGELLVEITRKDINHG